MYLLGLLTEYRGVVTHVSMGDPPPRGCNRKAFTQQGQSLHHSCIDGGPSPSLSQLHLAPSRGRMQLRQSCVQPMVVRLDTLVSVF